MKDDLISRQTAIDAVHKEFDECLVWDESGKHTADEVERVLTDLPSAQPERLTDDDFETIRIHLNAFKEKLGNQHRWKEAEEYQRIIDRFMAFALAQPEHTETHSCDYQRTETHGWIPVTERLPKNGHYYLKCTKYGNVDVDYYWDGFENATKYGEEIVAWMEKPKPYKGGQDETN